MGIQINGNTNNINAGIGSLSIEDLNELDIVGVATASNFKTGSSNLHSTGLTVGNALVHSTGINVGTGATVHCPSTNTLTFGTNSSERLRVTNTGRVGIGSDIPVAHLDVANNQFIEVLRLRDRHFNKYLTIRGGGTPNRMVIDSYEGDGGGADIDLASNGSTKLRVTSGGAVQITGADDQDNFEINVNSSQFAVHTDDTDGEVSLRSQDGSGSNNSKYMTFYTNPSGSAAAERLRITSSGHLKMPDAAEIQLGNDTQTATGDLRLFHNGSNSGIINSQGALYIQNTATNSSDLHLQGKTSIQMHCPSDGDERLRIKSDGKIQFSSATDNILHTSSNSSRLRLFGGSNESVSNGGVLTLHGVSHSAGNYTDLAAATGGHIRFRSGTTERMRISSEGYVNKPYHPAFAARLGSNVDITSNTSTDLVFNIQEFDNSSSYDTSNGRFTAPVAGKYYFGVQIYAGFNGAGVRVMHAHFRVNGTSVAQTDMFGGASNHGGTHYHPTAVGHMFRELNANDYVTFNLGGFSHTGGQAILYASTGNRFFGHLVT